MQFCSVCGNTDMPLIDNTTKSRDHVLLQKKKKERKKEVISVSF